MNFVSVKRKKEKHMCVSRRNNGNSALATGYLPVGTSLFSKASFYFCCQNIDKYNYKAQPVEVRLDGHILMESVGANGKCIFIVENPRPQLARDLEI